MNFIEIILQSGLNSDQRSLMDALKRLGGDSIQTAHGLFTAINHDVNAVRDSLAASHPRLSVEIRSISPDETDDLSPDMVHLIEKYDE